MDAGKNGAQGDAACWNTCNAKRLIESGEWGATDPFPFPNATTIPEIRPYIVADAAFGLSCTLTKCYDCPTLSRDETRFNYCVIRTRRVVEQAFGRLKGRWHILLGTAINDPVFAAEIAVICAALHNVCEKRHAPFPEQWAVLAHPSDDASYNDDDVQQDGQELRQFLTEYLASNN